MNGYVGIMGVAESYVKLLEVDASNKVNHETNNSHFEKRKLEVQNPKKTYG